MAQTTIRAINRRQGMIFYFFFISPRHVYKYNTQTGAVFRNKDYIIIRTTD